MAPDTEERLLMADLLARCMDAGLSRDELMRIITGQPGEVSTLLQGGMSVVIETRARHLLALIGIVRDVCNDRVAEWLRAPNATLGLRSPVQTLLSLPGSLESMLRLMREYRVPDQLIH